MSNDNFQERKNGRSLYSGVITGLALAGFLTASATAQEGPGEEGFTPPSPEVIAEELFENRDINQDGILTQAEYTANPTDYFSEWDINQDGLLTLDEIPTELPEDAGLRMRRGPARGEGVSERERPRFSRIRLLGHLDRDGDEALSLEEFLAPAERSFDGLDADESGDLTFEEAVSSISAFQATREERREKRRGKRRQRTS